MPHPLPFADSLDALRALLSTPKRLALITHYNPDGDAIGSSLGLMHVMRAAGHQATVVLPNAAPSFLQWMPGYAEVLVHEPKRAEAPALIKAADAVICLDFNRRDRVGGLEEALRAAPFTVLIDHHQAPEDFAQIAFSDTSACATSQMVHAIVEALGWSDRISLSAATCLYTGIVTDSGSFRFGSTTPRTMRVAGDLMERGVPFSQVHEAIHDDNRVERLRLQGFMLSERLEVLPELSTAIITLSRADLDRFRYQPGDTEGFVNLGLSIRGIRLSAFFMERPDLVKVSLRSKGDLPVDGIVRDHFNGGGHRNAAGGQAKESLAATVERFRAMLPAFMAAHP